MDKYCWSLIATIFTFFITSLVIHEVYAFVYDIEPNSHIAAEYLHEMTCTDSPISFQEWMDRQDQKIDNLWDWFGDGCASALDPTYNSPYGYGHNERD